MLSERFWIIGLWVLGFLVLGSALAAFAWDQPLFLSIPFAIAGLTVVLFFQKPLHYLLWFSIPFSMDIYLGSLALSVPTEPIMMALTGIGIVLLIMNWGSFKTGLSHPLFLALLAGFGWMALELLYSTHPVLSLKYLLAKCWFIGSLVIIPLFFIRDRKDVLRLFWCLIIGVFTVTLYVDVRHTLLGLGFGEINQAVYPFFSNHVMFAALIGLTVPIVWYVRGLYPSYSLRYQFLTFVQFVLLFGVIFSYTRTTWLAIPFSVLAFQVMKRRLQKPIILVAILVLIGGLLYLSSNKKYLDYAPNFEKTVFNKGNIKKHLEATYKLEDVSGMERVYRWVAAARMIEAHPITGTGTNTFYSEYKKYTVTSFRTYVSDNPERSTTHNYFLMVFAEQGIIGFLLFGALFVLLLVHAEKSYFLVKDPDLKRLTIAVYLVLIILFVNLTLSDLIETDKVGAFFFLSLVLLIKLDHWIKADQKNLQDSTVISSDTD